MAGLLRSIVQLSRSVIPHIWMSPANNLCARTLPSITSWSPRLYSQDPYNPYPTYDTPSPYKKQEKFRHGYVTKHFTGGILPRPKVFADKPLPLRRVDLHKRDAWVPKKALFGQNDYIDILGDGTIHPAQLIKGPSWLRGYRGNELQRLVRRLKFEGSYMKEYYPSKHHDLQKRITYLYKRMNLRKRQSNWGRHWSRMRARIDKKQRF